MMRRFPCLIGLVLAMVCLTAPASSAVGETLTVKSRQAQLRSTPSFTATVAKTIPYGEQVEVLAEQGAWRRISSASGARGWVHVSSLSDGYIVLKPGSREHNPVAGKREVSLAGKGLAPDSEAGEAQTLGFDNLVEKRYRQGNPGGYAQVNAMARTIFTPKSLLDFLSAGGVTPPGEAAP